MNFTEKVLVMTQDDMSRILRRIAIEIIERNKGLNEIVLLGIQRRGVHLADRLRMLFLEMENLKVPTGELDITLYRDDITMLSEQPIVHSTSLPVDIAGKKLILVDDVIYTGRTVRAALDALMDFGRPESVQLVALTDRGHRELPIHPDYIGKKIPTSKEEIIQVMVNELDGEDKVLIAESDHEEGGTS